MRSTWLFRCCAPTCSPSGVRPLRIALVLLSLYLPAPVRADPAAQARFHDELARSHYNAGRFEHALREFFLEQRISQNPRISFNIAVCFLALNRREQAFEYLGEYLASSDGDAERRAYAERVTNELKPSLALVRVTSDPVGAEIFVDRRELGSFGRTPKLIAVPAGQHQISVELPGHRPASAEVTAERGREQVMMLNPERILGKLSILSALEGSVLVRSLSGETQAQGRTPLEASLSPGVYEVIVRAAGYRPWTGFTRVDANETANVEAHLVPNPEPTGSITVTSNVPGALVELNGEPAGFSPTVLSNVKLGEHEIKVHTPRRLPWSGIVRVAADERAWVTVSLEEPPTVQRSPGTWVAGGIGAAALATSGVLGILAARTHSQFEDADTGPERNALRERGLTLNTAADVAWITGAVAGVTAVILYFATSEVRGRPSAASIAESKH